MKRPKTDQKLAAEFAIIVIGVFVALAAESWWSEREQRKFEREIREDMLVEFKSNIAILDADIEENHEVRVRFDALRDDLGQAMTPDAKLSGEPLPYLDWAGFDPELGSRRA